MRETQELLASWGISPGFCCLCQVWPELGAFRWDMLVTGPGPPGSISSPLSLGSCCGCPSFLSTLSHTQHIPQPPSPALSHTHQSGLLTEECCGVHSLRSKGNDRLGLSSGLLSGGSGRPGTLFRAPFSPGTATHTPAFLPQHPPETLIREAAALLPPAATARACLKRIFKNQRSRHIQLFSLLRKRT